LAGGATHERLPGPSFSYFPIMLYFCGRAVITASGTTSWVAPMPLVGQCVELAEADLLAPDGACIAGKAQL